MDVPTTLNLPTLLINPFFKEQQHTKHVVRIKVRCKVSKLRGPMLDLVEIGLESQISRWMCNERK